MGIFRKKRWVRPIFVGSNGNDLTRGIYVFHFDIDNGEFLKKKFYKSLANPSSLFKRERFIYVTYKNKTGRVSDGGVWQYASMDLQFGLAAKATYEGHTYECTYVDEDRHYAYAVDYYNSEVVTIAILNQKLVKMTQVLHHDGHGLDEIKQEKAHPCYINATFDKKHIFVCDLGLDQIIFYSVGENGKLEKDENMTIHLDPGSGPKKMIYSPDGHFAYVINELNSSVDVFDCHNQYQHVQHVLTYPKDEYIHANYCGDIVINEEGDFLFITNCGHDSIAVYQRNNDTGMLELIEYMDTDENPKNMIMVNNHWVIVASQKGGTIESFEIKRGESKGILFESHFSYMVGEPVCLVEGRGF